MTPKLSPTDIAREIRKARTIIDGSDLDATFKAVDFLRAYLFNHAKEIASTLESKHHHSCRSVTMGDLCDCEAKRIASLESDLERYRAELKRKDEAFAVFKAEVAAKRKESGK